MINQAMVVHRAAAEQEAVHPPVAVVADHLVEVLRLVVHQVEAVDSRVGVDSRVVKRVGEQVHRALPLPQLHFRPVFTVRALPLKST